MRGIGTGVEHDAAVAHMLARHTRATVDNHLQIGCEALIDAPFMNGADQIRLGGE